MLRAEERPDAVAMVFDERKVSYGELARTAGLRARALAERGVRPGSRVGVATRDFIDNFTTRVATWLLGAATVPIDVFSPAAERRRLWQTMELSHLVEDRPYLAEPGVSIQPTDLVDGPALKIPFMGPEYDPESYATIALTSGTTGDPAGVAVSHRALTSCASLYADKGMVHENTVFLNIGMHNVTGTNWRSYATLYMGGTVVFQPALQGASEVVETARTYGATLMLATPKLLADLINYAKQTPENALLPDLDWLVIGGASVSPQLLQDAVRLISSGTAFMYGASSAGAVSLLSRDELNEAPHSVGRAFPGVRIETVNDSDVPTDPGTLGHVRVQSTAIASEIVGPHRSAGDKIQNGWCYPGDIGVIDSKGYLQILGRVDEVINSAGVKVFPADIEGRLSRFPGIREVAVLGLPKEHSGQEILAFLVVEAGTTVSEIRAFARREIEPAKRPNRFFLLDSLPRNVGNKVVRSELLSIACAR